MVRGMGSLHDVVASFECADLKEKRRRALSHGLEFRGLVVEVTVLDDRCAAFIEGNLNTTAEEISATLLEERRSRLHALQTALSVLGYPDVGMSSVFYEDEWNIEHFQSFKRIKPLRFGIYPEREAVKKRFQGGSHPLVHKCILHFCSEHIHTHNPAKVCTNRQSPNFKLKMREVIS